MPENKQSRPGLPERLKGWARALKREVHALYFVGRDPRLPWTVKALIVVVVGYAISPIDLIPDFIPVVGYLDDMILLPLGIWLILRFVPADVLADGRARAAEAAERPVSRGAAAVIVAIWLVLVGLSAWLLYGWIATGPPGPFPAA